MIVIGLHDFYRHDRTHCSRTSSFKSLKLNIKNNLLFNFQMNSDSIVRWLMDGDVSIQCQVSRDILHAEKNVIFALQRRISTEGWGHRFLEKQNKNGHWGITFYQPKWTSTHYTLLDLRIIGLHPGNGRAQKSADMVLQQPEGADGGINLAVSLPYSDVCVNGMILNYASYFLPDHPRLRAIIDFLLHVQMADGGWNCLYRNKETTHSSLHSTLSVLEGLLEFRLTGQKYRITEILSAEKKAVEFLLRHHLYQSHRTGKIIDSKMLRLSFPPRWRYDILRSLDYLQHASVPYDSRMENALIIIKSKRRPDGKWLLQEKHKGHVHFDMEKTGEPSRWNTLRALRVLNYYQGSIVV